MEECCKRTNDGQISLEFQTENPIAFDIKIFVLPGLRDNQTNESAVRDPWEHLTCFYETCSMWKPEGVADSHIKLRLFGFSLTRRSKD